MGESENPMGGNFSKISKSTKPVKMGLNMMPNCFVHPFSIKCREPSHGLHTDAMA